MLNHSEEWPEAEPVLREDSSLAELRDVIDVVSTAAPLAKAGRNSRAYAQDVGSLLPRGPIGIMPMAPRIVPIAVTERTRYSGPVISEGRLVLGASHGVAPTDLLYISRIGNTLRLTKTPPLVGSRHAARVDDRHRIRVRSLLASVELADGSPVLVIGPLEDGAITVSRHHPYDKAA